MKSKKKIDQWFDSPVDTWDVQTCFKFLDLSETCQKRLPNFPTAGKAKGAVLKHLQQLIEQLSTPHHNKNALNDADAIHINLLTLIDKKLDLLLFQNQHLLRKFIPEHELNNKLGAPIPPGDSKMVNETITNLDCCKHVN